MIDFKPMPGLSDKELRRYNSYIAKGLSDCWLWRKCKNKGGYGKFKINQETFLPHRLAYWIKYKIDPKDKLVCHKCNNPSCVNPDHLYLGTYSDNAKQCHDDGRHPQKGENNQANSLTNNQVLEIRKLHFEGKITSVDIAEKFQITPSNVSYIVNRKTWRHI